MERENWEPKVGDICELDVKYFDTCPCTAAVLKVIPRKERKPLICVAYLWPVNATEMGADWFYPQRDRGGTVVNAHRVPRGRMRLTYRYWRLRVWLAERFKAIARRLAPC